MVTINSIILLLKNNGAFNLRVLAVVPCDNAAVCQNGAICRKNALQQDQCFCTPEYYGEFCDIPRGTHNTELVVS